MGGREGPGRNAVKGDAMCLFGPKDAPGVMCSSAVGYRPLVRGDMAAVSAWPGARKGGGGGLGVMLTLFIRSRTKLDMLSRRCRKVARASLQQLHMANFWLCHVGTAGGGDQDAGV